MVRNCIRLSSHAKLVGLAVAEGREGSRRDLPAPFLRVFASARSINRIPILPDGFRPIKTM